MMSAQGIVAHSCDFSDAAAGMKKSRSEKQKAGDIEVWDTPIPKPFDPQP